MPKALSINYLVCTIGINLIGEIRCPPFRSKFAPYLMHYKKDYLPPHLILPITSLISVAIAVSHI